MFSSPSTPNKCPACARAGDASSRKLGTFLVMSQFQGSVNSSAMFLTAAAQNLLCMKLATELGVIIASPWLTWFKVRATRHGRIFGTRSEPFALQPCQRF